MIACIRRWIQRLVREEIRLQLLYKPLIYGDEKRVTIADTAVVNNALFNVISGTITIEDCAFFGHNVALLTGTHDIRATDKVRQNKIPLSGRDIRICRGAWVSSNATILGPCVIGKNAVVAAGSVVVGDVPPGTLVGGNPARVLKTIEFVGGDPELEGCSFQ